MKIAFTSCFDAEDDPRQEVWDRIHALQPDVLLLLGDSVYMDFGVKFLGADRPLGWPRKKSDADFAAFLHGLYAKQWAVDSFRRLVRSGVRLGMTWDDHDFAWNGSRGAGVMKRYAVSPEKRRISRGLFMQFRNALETLPEAATYPPCPKMDTLLDQPAAGIQYQFDKSGVRFIMLDGRTFRQDPSFTQPPTTMMHGPDQMAWLTAQLSAWSGIKVVCAGSVLTGSSECWEQYMDYGWLLDQAPDKLIVLTGDIHKNKKPHNHRPSRPPLYEITASGAARPGPLDKNPRLFGATGNFGILNLNDDTAQVSLYSEEGISGPYALNF